MHTPATTAPGTRTTARTYPGKRDQVRHVRHDLQHTLAGCPAAADVILCASELAANAVLHSNSARPGGTITVRVHIAPGDHVQIEVDDHGGHWTQPAPDPTRGRGLDIIRGLAADWGITNTPRGRTIWARLTWPAS